MNEPVERVGRAQEVGIGGGGLPVEIDMVQRVGQGGGVSSSREASLTLEQELRAAAKAGGVDPDEVVARVERALAQAMKNPPPVEPCQPYLDPVFHVGYDGAGGAAAYHHGEFDGCLRCDPLAGAGSGQCHEPDFMGMDRWVRCALPVGHSGGCFLQPVPAERQDWSAGMAVFTVLVLGGFVGFALGVCAAISFGW